MRTRNMRRPLIAALVLMVLLPTVAYSVNVSLPFSHHFTALYPYKSVYNTATYTGSTIDNTEYAPGSSPSSLKFIYTSGWNDGNSPDKVYVDFTNHVQELWIEYWFKYSTGWTWHSVGDKQTYWPINHKTDGEFMLIVRDGAKKLQFSFQRNSPFSSYNRYQNVTSVTITPGIWYKCTAYAKMNTAGVGDGLFKLWINDTLTHNYTNITYRPTGSTDGFSGMEFTPVWGGNIGSTKPKTEYFWVDYIKVQETAFSQDTDTTAPYTDTFSPLDGAMEVSQSTTSASFHVKDSGGGVNISTLDVGGKHCPTCASCDSGLTCSGTSADYTITRTGLSLSYAEIWSEVIAVSDVAGNAMAAVTYNFTVQDNPVAALDITTTSLPAGSVNNEYITALSATGGQTPYVWSLSSGTLPTGLSIPSSGDGSWGTPNAAGTYSFTVLVTDNLSTTHAQALSITISPAIQDNVSKTPPNAPTDHYVQAGDGQVTLHPGTSTGATFYTAYYTADGSTPTKAGGITISSVTDNQTVTGLTNDVLHKFVFTASNLYGESVESSVDSVTPKATPASVPDAPTGIIVLALSASVRLYPGSSPGATSYNCYYTADGTAPTTGSTKITGAKNGQIVSGLTNGTYYRFACTAVNGVGESVIGTSAGVTPTALSNGNFLTGTGNSSSNITGSQKKNYLQ